MRHLVPRSALALQTAFPILIVIFARVTELSSRAEAAKYPGPPYYLPFLLECWFLAGVLLIAAVLLWMWRWVGWYLCITVDVLIAVAGVALFVYCIYDWKAFGIDVMDDLYNSLFFAALIPVILGTATYLLARKPSRQYFRALAN